MAQVCFAVLAVHPVSRAQQGRRIISFTGRTSSKWEKEVAREPSDPWESEKARKIPRKGERKGGWVRGDLAAAPLTFAPTHTDAA